MGFSRQEYWSGLPLPSPGDLPNLGLEPGSPALQTDALPSEPLGKPENSNIYDKNKNTPLPQLALKIASLRDFLGGPLAKNLPASTGNMCLILGLGRFHMLWGN